MNCLVLGCQLLDCTSEREAYVISYCQSGQSVHSLVYFNPWFPTREALPVLFSPSYASLFWLRCSGHDIEEASDELTISPRGWFPHNSSSVREQYFSIACENARNHLYCITKGPATKAVPCSQWFVNPVSPQVPYQIFLFWVEGLDTWGMSKTVLDTCIWITQNFFKSLQLKMVKSLCEKTIWLHPGEHRPAWHTSLSKKNRL